MTGPDQVAAPALLRRLRRVDIVALTINAVVGAGIFAMTAGLTAAAGRWSIAVLGAAVVLVTVCALSLAEVSSRYEVTGSPQVYAQDAFGPLAGYTVGWLLAISRLASYAALSHVMMSRRFWSAQPAASWSQSVPCSPAPAYWRRPCWRRRASSTPSTSAATCRARSPWRIPPGERPRWASSCLPCSPVHSR